MLSVVNEYSGSLWPVITLCVTWCATLGYYTIAGLKKQNKILLQEQKYNEKRYVKLRFYYTSIVKKYKQLLARYDQTRSKLLEVSKMHFGEDFITRILNESSGDDGSNSSEPDDISSLP